MIGKALAHYEITSQLGKGDIGGVFRTTSAMKGKEAKGQKFTIDLVCSRK